MLVLSRKIGETIEIGGGIRVTVTEVRGGRVRLSIQAPPDVRVLRKELIDALTATGLTEEPDPLDRS